MSAVPITILGEEFVILPRREYEDLQGIPPGSVEAVSYARKVLGQNLRKARESAGLTQAEVARRLERSQAFISATESGTTKVGQRYVSALLKICNLPQDWSPGSPSCANSASLL